MGLGKDWLAPPSRYCAIIAVCQMQGGQKTKKKYAFKLGIVGQSIAAWSFLLYFKFL